MLNSLNISLADLAALCALVLLSPDREGLSKEGKEAVSKIQPQIIPVSYIFLLHTYHHFCIHLKWITGYKSLYKRNFSSYQINPIDSPAL